jgi:hypothetical protein
MSSGTPFNPSGVNKMLKGLANRLTRKNETQAESMARIRRLGLSPRQQRLNHLWAWYCAEHYSNRRVDWNGNQAIDPIDHEAIATAGFIPPGFYDAGSTMPIKFRKPSAPYALVRVIVDRFTGLLFSEQRHPHLHIEGDKDTEEYINSLFEHARMWANMMHARKHGGSMGTACAGFQFLNGKLAIEVHDPRWTEPHFDDRVNLTLESIEKKFMYPVETKDPATGVYQEVPYWYRRIVDKTTDTLFKSVPVGDGEEPEWTVEKQVEHNFGFCPVVWVQNLPVQDDIDGDSDCVGVYDLVETIDALLAQANKGILANSDPTAVIITDAEMAEVRKGSDNAIKLPQGGSANYMEISGSGPKTALELAEQLRKYALEVVQCTLDHANMQQRTATEIERVYSSMLAKADTLREQYGQKLIIPLAEMILSAIRKLGEGKLNPETNMIEKQQIMLPARAVFNDKTEQIEMLPHSLGPGGLVTLQWPRYFEPLLTDVELAARSAIAAKAGQLIDAEHAAKFIAEYFRVEDVPGMLARIQKETKDQQERLADQALGMLRDPGIPSNEFEE